MPHSPRITLAAALVGACAFLVGCGSSRPDAESIQAWRVSQDVNPNFHDVEEYKISDVECTEAAERDIEKIKGGYKLFSQDPDKWIKAYASCSYTIDAKLKSKGGWFVRDVEVRGRQVKNQMWVLAINDDKSTKWRNP